MTREEQLYFCKRCSNRQFDTKRGLICKLTNDYATFEVECEQYEADPTAIKDNDRWDAQINEREEKERTMGLAAIGIKNGTAAGVLITFGGFTWLVLGVVLLESIFLWSIGMMVAGIILLVKDRSDKAKLKRQNRGDSNTLDGDL